MLLPVDRTADFEQLLRARTKGEGEDVFYAADDTIVDTFTGETTALRGRIEDMREVITRNRRRYCDFSARGMRDGERDAVDASLGEFLRGAMAQLDALKRAHRSAHELGVALVLSSELQALGASAEDLRAARIRHAMAANVRPGVKVDAGAAAELAAETPRSADDDLSVAATGMAMEFAQENAALVADLVETRERVRQAERDVAEIAGLNHVFATKVLEQAREIEGLYNTALDATNYLDYGNKQLMAMRGKRNQLTYGVALFLFLASLVIILYEVALSRLRPF